MHQGRPVPFEKCCGFPEPIRNSCGSNYLKVIKRRLPTQLTSAQEDYLEVIYRLEQVEPKGSTRVSEIAARLGTRLPTVTRTVRRLTELGLLRHADRREVSLTASGRRIAAEVVHRHEDLVTLFVEVLGLDAGQAEEDACQIEHGLSRQAAQRLHEFLEFLQGLDPGKRELLGRFKREASHSTREFDNLPAGKASGWRT